ncbi:MAG: antirestriction protein ArdA [Fluviibacter phosphoraccumulans]
MSSAFFYVDGIPTKGTWVNLEFIGGWNEVLQELSAAGYANPNEILCADAEGLAKHFLSRYDCFDLASYTECRDECSWASEEAKSAYMECFGSWDAVTFEDIYCGEWDSDTALAEDYIDSTGILSSMPDNLRGYFDTAAFARDLMLDYSESGGHYFRNI